VGIAEYIYLAILIVPVFVIIMDDKKLARKKQA